MMNLTLQAGEVCALEALLDKLLTNTAASKVVFEDGAQRRSVKRVLMKLHWAKAEQAPCQP